MQSPVTWKSIISDTTFQIILVWWHINVIVSPIKPGLHTVLLLLYFHMLSLLIYPKPSHETIYSCSSSGLHKLERTNSLHFCFSKYLYSPQNTLILRHLLLQLCIAPFLCYSMKICMNKLTTVCYHSFCQRGVSLHSLTLSAPIGVYQDTQLSMYS